MNTPRARQAGVVLLLVLAILGLLSVLAVSFVSMARLERSISRNYLAQTRAWMAAESGIEYAIARLQGYNGALSDEEMDDMSFVPGAKPGLMLADKASFQMTEETKRPISGRIESGDDDTYYILRVEDGSGRLNLNDSNGAWNIDDDPQPDDPESDDDLLLAPGRLRKTVEALGNILFEEPTGTLMANALFDDSFDFTRSRPNLAGGVFSTMDQVRDALVIGYPSAGLPPALSEDQFDEFKNYVTLWSWQDPDVIRPTFQFEISLPESRFTLPPNRYTPPFVAEPFPSDGEGNGYIPSGDPPDPLIVSYDMLSSEPTVIINTIGLVGHVMEPQDASRDVYLFSDWQTKSFELEPRCPVNVNTAPVELLEAMIAPVCGWYLREGPGEILSTGERHHNAGQAYRAIMTSMDTEIFTGTAGSSWRYGCPVSMYCWEDESAIDIRGRINATKAPSGFRKDGRFGEAHRTPDLRDILDVDLNEDGATGDFPSELAAALHDRIHGTGSDEGRPFATWQEMSLVLRDIADRIPDSHASWDDSWWRDWIPGVKGYDGRIERICATWHGGVPAQPLHEPTADRAFWAQRCREVLVDCLLANFNPNSRFNDYNPDRHLFTHVDKAQLTQYTSEWCFEPTGVFQISSLGAVAEPSSNVVIAKQTIASTIRVFDSFRVTRQDQFVGGGNGGPLDWSARSTTNPYDDTPWNCTIMSYPEPLLRNTGNPNLPLSDHAATSRFDGSVGLATLRVDTGPGDFYISFEGTLDAETSRAAAEPHVTPGSRKWIESSCLMNFPPAGYALTGKTDGAYPKMVPRNHPTTDRLTGGGTPGALLADGALSDAGRCLMYEAVNIGDPLVEGRRGGLEFWIKPNFDTRSGTRMRRFFSMVGRDYYGGCKVPGSDFGLTFFPHVGFADNHNYPVGFQRVETGALDARNLLWAADTGGYNESPHWVAPSGLVFMYFCSAMDPLAPWGRIGMTTPSLADELVSRQPGNPEQLTHPSGHFEPHAWSHVSIRWNQTLALDYMVQSLFDVQRTLNVVVNGVDPLALPERHHWSSGMTSSAALNLHQADEGPVYLRLGETTEFNRSNWAADATYDEVVAYANDSDMPDRAIQNIYAELGRYYHPSQRDEIAVYLSPGYSLDRHFHTRPNESITIRSVSWTCYWPEFNRRVDHYQNASGTETNPDLRPWNVDNDAVGYDSASASDRRDDPLVDLLDWVQPLDPMSIDLGRRTPAGKVFWIADQDGDSDIYDDHGHALTYAGGSRVETQDAARKPLKLQAGDELVFRAYFNVDPNLDQSIFESPVLDDVTFTCMKSVPDVLYWNAVNES